MMVVSALKGVSWVDGGSGGEVGTSEGHLKLKALKAAVLHFG